MPTNKILLIYYYYFSSFFYEFTYLFWFITLYWTFLVCPTNRKDACSRHDGSNKKKNILLWLVNFRTARVTRVDETRLRLRDVLQKRGLSNWRKTEDEDRFLQCSQTVSTFTANTSRHNHPFEPDPLRYPHLLRSEVFKRSSQNLTS